MKEQIKHFAEKVDKRGTEECWEWKGEKSPQGYGITMAGGRLETAPRLTWQFFFGDIPKGQSVLHRCDNPSCVNPYHLFLGTQQDNIQDSYKKGRGTHQKLSWIEVRQIRELYPTGKFSQSVLAEMFGVTQGNISAVCRRRSYGYID